MTGNFRLGSNWLSNDGGSEGISVDTVGVVTASSVIRTADGTANTPAYSFTSDPDTGIWRAGANSLAISTSGVERIRISSEGYLGIGTSVPTSAIYIAGTSGATSGLGMESRTDTAVLGPPIALKRARDNAGANEAVQLDDVLGVISSFGYGTNSYTIAGNAAMQFLADENFTNAARGTRIEFQTTPNTTSTKATVMTIDSTGYVGIGTTSPGEKLEVSGNVKATTFISTSDARMKRDIATVENALDKVLSLRGVSYNWASDGTADLGVIAQEVEEIFPALVVTNKNGFKAVKYQGLISPLIEATKELNNKCDMSQRQLADLESRVKKTEENLAVMQREIQSLKQENEGLKQMLKSMDDRLRAVENKK